MINIRFEELISELKSISSKKVLITFHSVGDTDSVSSAFGIASLMENAVISTPDYITSNSKKILDSLGYKLSDVSKDFDDSFDAVIMVDVNNYADCGRFAAVLKKYGDKLISIDHHAPSEDNIRAYNDESFNSTASIVYSILKNLNAPITKNLASLLAAGIISDSAEFKNSMPDTFIQLGELFKIAGTNYVEMLDLISSVGDVNGRHLTFKDLQSSSSEVYDNMLVVHGKAHSHPGLAADHAIKCGVDLAIFYSISESEVSFSSRLRPPLDIKYKIHLGKISQKLAYLLEGNGGGHPCAAGAFGSKKESSQIFIDAFINEVLSALNGGIK